MSETEIDVPAADGVADAYFVKPDGPGPYPGVLLFMDVFGLRPQIREKAARIAERGYAVLVPNLFYRGARSPLVEPGELADAAGRGAAYQRLVPSVQALTRERIIADTGAYLDFLATRDGVAAGPAGVVGYCMGGRNALIVAAAHPERIALLASFHAGGVVTDAPDSPHLSVPAILAEAYFGHADDDGSMTPEHVKALEEAFESAGVTYTSELYAGAQHGFTMADTSAHDPAAEQRHWAALFAALDRALPPGPVR